MLIYALKAGYQAVAVVRRQDAADLISNAPAAQPFLTNGSLTFALVPDNTQPDAYHDAAKGCTYIIHLASPLAGIPGDLVTPAVAGTKAALSAAEATPTIKRVVFTGSTSSLRHIDQMMPSHPRNQAIAAGNDADIPPTTADTRVPTPPAPPADAPPFERYVASKVTATNTVDAYAASPAFAHAHFSVVSLFPGWVLGPSPLATNKPAALHTSNVILSWLFHHLKLNPLLNIPPEVDDVPAPADTVHVDDVAEAHVNALDTARVPGRQRSFLLASDSPHGAVWSDAETIVRTHLPQEVAAGKIPFAGHLGEFPPLGNGM